MALYQKCIPSDYVASIFEIDYQNLKKQGIKSLFFDLDNTVIPYDETELSSQHIAFFNTLKKDFNVLIISNSGYPRVSNALKNTDLPYIYHGMKPTKIGLKKALKLVKSSPQETILIGDQLMTDIFGASRLKMRAILVKAVKQKSDRWMTKINRKIEKMVLKKIKKKEPKLYEERLKAYVEGK
ncbi:MAG: YqeG family HAD IIIA-type phosphatase [Bacillota bacterium]|nr:MAG: YqeG family HAD IIIA-type phosphatase [Bacillota bacterium]